MKLKQIRLSRGLKSKEIALRCGTDEAGWSKIETYKYLPIPAMLNKICEQLECKPLDIYDRDEVTLVPPLSSKNSHNEKGESVPSRGYNLCVFLPEEYRDKLGAWVKELGFPTFQAWLLPYIKETEDKINARHK